MALTPEEIASIVEALKPAITEIASQSAADHVTKRNKSFETKLDEKLSFFQQPAKTEVEETVSNEKQSLTQKLARMEEDQKRLREELKQERESGQKKSMRSNLESQLLKSGVPANMLKAVSAQLIHEDKLVSMDADGTPVFRSTEYEGSVDLETGISEWFRGEGKAFLPAPKANGTGQRTVRSLRDPLTTEPTTQEEKDRSLLEMLRNSV